jgi:hypothetical protein
VKVVFPTLREKLKKHRVYLVNMAGGEAVSDKALDLCLQQIQESGRSSSASSASVTAPCPKALISKRAPNTAGSSTTPTRRKDFPLPLAPRLGEGPSNPQRTRPAREQSAAVLPQVPGGGCRALARTSSAKKSADVPQEVELAEEKARKEELT